jgi:hypothetical protein
MFTKYNVSDISLMQQLQSSSSATFHWNGFGVLCLAESIKLTAANGFEERRVADATTGEVVDVIANGEEDTGDIVGVDPKGSAGRLGEENGEAVLLDPNWLSEELGNDEKGLDVRPNVVVAGLRGRNRLRDDLEEEEEVDPNGFAEEPKGVSVVGSGFVGKPKTSAADGEPNLNLGGTSDPNCREPVVGYSKGFG